MSKILTLKYNLAELPSSQHRAGLAGLVLMARWLKDDPDKKGFCELTQIDETSATLQIDREGLQFLFDKVYAALKKEVKRETKIKKNKTKEEIPPLREERTVINQKGKRKEKIFYIYERVIPQGAFLVDYDRSDEGIWIKLWRDMIWSILRGKPRTRLSYEKRSEGVFTEDADEVWQKLNKKADCTVDLPSTYFIGAQKTTAENVSFKDFARYQFLLHFWVFVAQVYVPRELKYDRKTKSVKEVDVGFSLAIPDVAELETFCEELPDVLRSRSSEKSGYRPKESVIDIAAEGALDLMHKINQRIATRVNNEISDLLLGIDILHVEKDGNNIRIWSSMRIDPIRPMIDEYARVKDRFKNHLFRKQRMLNVLNQKDWFYGFDSLLSQTESERTIGNSCFRRDVLKAFEEFGVIGDTNKSRGENNMDANSQEPVPKTIEEIVYRLVGTYISAKLKSKYQLEWSNDYKNTEKEVEYKEKKSKVAREAFLAIRSRSEADFIEYFASTLCAFPQYLNEQSYETLAKALYTETDKVRTLTMLALSAKG